MERRGRPSVAVVIPCFDQGRFLRKAIDSAIRQSVAPDEIIVVDDGSDEELPRIAKSSAVSLIRQPNRGRSGAKNSGLKAAKSDKIVFLDADDVLHPDAIATGLECFRSHSDAAFVYGGFRVVTRRSREIAFTPISTHRELLRTNWIGMIAAVMFDREKLLQANGFDESLGMCEDLDLFLRLSRRFPFAAHRNIVADYVRHETNATNAVPELRKWIDIVRVREWERGLSAEDREAWREGEEVWRSRILDPVARSPVERAARRAARAVLRTFRT